MKKSLLFILILFGAVSLHAQTHKHYKDTIDVVMESSGIITQPNPVSVLICPFTYTFTLGPVTGGSGTSSYQWQMSYDNENWTNLLGYTSQNYTTPFLEWGTVTYYRRIATRGGCSITSNSASVTVVPLPPRPEFMAYNLGADSTLNTPKKQMEYLANDANGLTASFDNYGRVFGGRYQWGRQNLPYAINPSTYLLYNGVVDHSAALSGGATYDTDGQIIGQANNHVYNATYPYDWRGSGIATDPTVLGQWDALWGNGQAISTPTPGPGAVLRSDGNYYQRPDKTVNDPCPSGFRLPTQNDWELICNYHCDPATARGEGGYTGGIAKVTSGLTWVSVKCSGGTCKMATLAANARGGYAIYITSDWESAGYTAADDLISATTQPFLFLPATGYRPANSGLVNRAMGLAASYWSSTPGVTHPSYAFAMTFDDLALNPSDSGAQYRGTGNPIRCVKCAIGEPCYVPEP